jgi:hypothetical protein
MFVVGDVLIKIDQRAWVSAEFDTRHHAMLVIDVIEAGYPVVAHMKFINFETYTGYLVIETCPKTRDLILIHATTFSKAVRDKIAGIAQDAYRQGLLKIEKHFLAREYQAANVYRWDNRYDCVQKLDLIYEQVVKRKNMLADQEQMISCHDFVISVIQCAFHALGESVPWGFNFEPSLAWSDILYEAVRQDKTLRVSWIRSIEPRCSIPGQNNRVFSYKKNSSDVPSKQDLSFPSCVIQ